MGFLVATSPLPAPIISGNRPVSKCSSACSRTAAFGYGGYPIGSIVHHSSLFAKSLPFETQHSINFNEIEIARALQKNPAEI